MFLHAFRRLRRAPVAAGFATLAAMVVMASAAPAGALDVVDR